VNNIRKQLIQRIGQEEQKLNLYQAKFKKNQFFVLHQINKHKTILGIAFFSIVLLMNIGRDKWLIKTSKRLLKLGILALKTNLKTKLYNSYIK
jgi:hypothetical protein